jgi:hypothetical protein
MDRSFFRYANTSKEILYIPWQTVQIIIPKVFQNNPSTNKRAALMIGTIGRTHCTGMQLSRSRGRSIFQLFDGIDNIVAKCQLYGVPHGIFQVFIIKWDVQHWGFGSLFWNLYTAGSRVRTGRIFSLVFNRFIFSRRAAPASCLCFIHRREIFVTWEFICWYMYTFTRWTIFYSLWRVCGCICLKYFF